MFPRRWRFSLRFVCVAVAVAATTVSMWRSYHDADVERMATLSTTEHIDMVRAVGGRPGMTLGLLSSVTDRTFVSVVNLVRGYEMYLQLANDGYHICLDGSYNPADEPQPVACGERHVDKWLVFAADGQLALPVAYRYEADMFNGGGGRQALPLHVVEDPVIAGFIRCDERWWYLSSCAQRPR